MRVTRNIAGYIPACSDIEFDALRFVVDHGQIVVRDFELRSHLPLAAREMLPGEPFGSIACPLVVDDGRRGGEVTGAPE